MKQRDGKKNNRAKISVNIDLPDFSPNGDIPLRVTAISKETGSALAIIDKQTQKPLDSVCNINISRFQKKDYSGQTTPLTKIETKNTNTIITLNGKEKVPLLWAHEAPSFDKLHNYSSTDIRIHHIAISKPRVISNDPASFHKSMAVLDLNMTELLRTDPDAYAVIQIGMRPDMAWLKQHPEEHLMSAFGEKGPVSFSSKAYQQAAMTTVKKIVDFLKTKPYYSRVAGYIPFSCGQPDSVIGNVSGSRFQQDRSKLPIGDFNPQALAAFQEFLRQKYNNSIPKLRKAWKSGDVTFDNAKPKHQDLVKEGTDGGLFRDPAVDGMMAFDYFEFMSNLMPDFYLKLAKLIKDETDGKALVGTYYMYILAGTRAILPPGGHLQSNNYEYKKLIESPYIDFYCGPIEYYYRLAGTPLISWHPRRTMQLHNKLFIAELDTRTFISGEKNWGRNRSSGETEAIMQRDLATTIIKGTGAWFADWSVARGRAGVGFFLEDSILKTIKKGKQIYNSAIEMKTKSTAEIAVIVSPEAMYYHDAYGTPVLYRNIYERMVNNELTRLGTPYDIYMIDDLKNESLMKQYKLFVFINPFYVSKQDRSRIEKLKTNGNTLLWFYAPGYVDQQAGLDVENISSLTGINIAKKHGKELMKYNLKDSSHSITAGLDKNETFKLNGFGGKDAMLHPISFGPVFYVDDSAADPLGTYPDGKTALAVKELENHNSIYCAVPYMNSNLIRNIAMFAGVHIYCDQDILLNANSSFVMLHNGFDGIKELSIKLPEKKHVYDAFAERVVDRNVDSLNIVMPECKTYLFELR